MTGGCELSPEKAMIKEIVQAYRDESQYEVAAPRVDEIAQRYLKSAEPHERLDMERTAARLALDVATDRGAPFDALSERFHARCALGFRDICSELAVLTDFGFACSELGEREAGSQVVSQAQERLAAAEHELP